MATDESPELPEHADLCALADGSLPPDRAAAVEARVAASVELRELVARQQRAVASARVLTAEPVPDSLRSSIESYRRRRTFRFAPRLALAGAVAAVAVVAAQLLTGGPAAPTVAEAAALSARPPNAAAPERRAGDPTRLATDVEGVAFPDLAAAYRCRAVGLRQDRLDGRRVTTVYYDKGARRIA